ncbi:MAG: hypothetical protein MK116_01975 [Phycisphaerales bacterium]|nr:hypothetical protein [Phycisphaerales bacterium]
MPVRTLFLALATVVLAASTSCRSRQATEAPGPLSPVSDGVDYMGTWAINDTENQLFNIVVRPDRSVVSNWSKGTRGAWGERGTWKRSGARMIIEYGDGWTDVLFPSRYGVSRQSYRPGVTTTDTPTSVGSAVAVDGGMSRYCGVFQFGEEDDVTYVSLLSSGLAYRSPTPTSGMNTSVSTEVGTWTVSGDTAVLSWSDGTRQRVAWERGVYVVQFMGEDGDTPPSSGRLPRMLQPVDGLAFGGRLP